jgi:DNA polymerase I-like protein with 3'-5' exonuclease and polymerase domains
MLQVDLFPPPSDWRAPTSLPHIPDGTLVAVDTETRDNGLAQGRGPGWVHRDGWLAGVSWAWAGGSGYAPIRHPDTEGCFEEEVVLAWLADVERRCRLVFQNAGYDLGWTDIRPTRRIGDTHTMAVLVDENLPAYDLDSLCRWQGIAGKDESLLREAAAAMGLGQRGRLTNKEVKSNLWRMPARYVGPYAEEDAVATLELAGRLQAQIIGQELTAAYELEADLLPHIMEMRRRGIRIDLDQVDRSQVRFRQLAADELQRVREHCPQTQRRAVTIQDVRSPRWLENLFGELGVPFPRTEKTEQGSFDKEWLERVCPHPVGRHIAQARALHDADQKFLGTYILEHTHMGRIHAEIHQLRDTDAGTRTFRMSYSNPPLQQMNRADPDRANPEHKDYQPGFVDIGSEIRNSFVPEEGEVWAAPDYSQQEYRLIVHYSALMDLPGSADAVALYHTNPKQDFHNLVVEMTGLTRKRAKDCNFAKAFGAGIPKFALMTGMALEEAQATMNQYDERLPFVSKLAEKCKAMADKRGYVRLIDGRRRHFNEWEAGWVPPEEWSAGRLAGHMMTPCSHEEALRRQDTEGHPWKGKRLRRADTRKAGNSVIQGSGAVMTKRAMLMQAQEGYLPLLQMHDELCHSVGDPVKARRIAEIMVEAVPLQVPVRVDNEFGTTWGTAKYTFEEAMRSLGRTR